MVQGLFLSFRLSSTRINKGFYPLLRKITINRRAPFTSRAWIIFIAPTEIILFALRYLPFGVIGDTKSSPHIPFWKCAGSFIIIIF